MEYVDDQYEFRFQFPADWTLRQLSPPQKAAEAGEVRALVEHSAERIKVMSIVGFLPKPLISRERFESNPNRNGPVGGMIDASIERHYQATSRQLGADQMIVTEKRILPSQAGIKFHISTTNLFLRPRPDGVTEFRIAGVHIFPFEKRYMIALILFTPVDKNTMKIDETMTRLFNSFHVAGESPSSK